MRRAEFLGRFCIGVSFVIGGLQLFLGDVLGHCSLDHFARDQLATFVFKRHLDPLRHFAVKILRQGGLLHKLIQNALEQDFGGKLLILFGQSGTGNDHAANRDVGAIDRGNHGFSGDVCLRIRFFGSVVLRNSRQGERSCHHEWCQKSERFLHVSVLGLAATRGCYIDTV